MMNAKVVVNNYQLGAMVKTTPTHKILSKKRLDRNHTEIIYGDMTKGDIEFTEFVLKKKLKVWE